MQFLAYVWANGDFFALIIGDPYSRVPLTKILRNAVFFESKNPCKGGTLSTVLPPIFAWLKSFSHELIQFLFCKKIINKNRNPKTAELSMVKNY